MVRKKGGSDDGQLYAMKVLKKATIVQKKKTAEHTKTERQVLAKILFYFVLFLPSLLLY